MYEFALYRIIDHLTLSFCL